MKLKKLAAKVSSLALVTTFFTCTNVFAGFEGLFYPNYSIEGQVTTSGKNLEVVITGAHRELYERNYSGKRLSEWEINNRVNDDIERIGGIKKNGFNIKKVTCEGITYEFLPENGELKITGNPGCCPYARESALKLLSVMDLVLAEKTYEDKWNPKKARYEKVKVYTPGYTDNSEKIKKVTIEGDIRIIPDFFLGNEFAMLKPGHDADPGLIHPEIIDLSHSNVETIGLRAFNIAGLRRIILPDHPITFLTQFPDFKGRFGNDCEIGTCDHELAIENEKFAKYSTCDDSGINGQLFSSEVPSDCCLLV